MDARTNPYAPGAGTPPPELAGRDNLIEDAAIALDRIRNGLAAKSLLMVGLCGVGKTVLLNRICRDSEDRGFTTLLLEAPEDRSLPGLFKEWGPLLLDCQGGDSIWMSAAKGSKLRRFQVRMADAPALSAAVAIRASYICPPRTPSRSALRTASQVS